MHWAREGSGFTLLFEAMALRIAPDIPLYNAAEIMGEHDTRIWRIVHHYADKAHAESDWSELKRIAVDETSKKKGHNYVTNFIDLETGALLFMTPGKDNATIGKFVEQLVDYNGSAKSLTEIAMDVNPAFRKGATEHLPQAEKVFDRFHVMMLAGEAFDKVRREVSREAGGLGRGGMWALRGNAERLSEEMRAIRERLVKEHSKLGRAMNLREFLRDLWNDADRERARGYRNLDNFRAILYWIAGDIQVTTNLPKPLPQPFFAPHDLAKSLFYHCIPERCTVRWGGIKKRISDR